jgi:CRP/FNR family transcriptional regulator
MTVRAKSEKISTCQGCTECIEAFRDLTSSQRRIFHDNRCENIYARGQAIYYEGMEPTGLFCIHSGLVKLSKMNGDGKEHILRLVKEGALLGTTSLLADSSYSHAATALSETSVCFIPRRIFVELVREDHRLAMQILSRLAEEQHDYENRLIKMAYHTVRERLADTLLFLREISGVQHDGQTLNVMLTREEMANLVGTATETVIRLLSQFQEDRIIELKGRRIKILNTGRLTKTANLSD